MKPEKSGKANCKIKAAAVLFDVGHTILFPNDSFFYQIAHRHGSQMSQEHFNLLGAKMKEKAYRKNPLNPYKLWFTKWMLGAGVSLRSLPQIYLAILKRHRQNHLWDTLEPSVPEVFKRLRERKFVLGVISNADGTIKSMLESLNLDFYFGCVIDSAVVGVEKPDARIFLMAAKALNLKPEQCVYVGDQLLVDVKGASAVGMTPVLLDPYDLVKDADCLRIQRLIEIVDHVESN